MTTSLPPLSLLSQPTIRSRGLAPGTRETTVLPFARSQGVIPGPSIPIPSTSEYGQSFRNSSSHYQFGQYPTRQSFLASPPTSLSRLGSSPRQPIFRWSIASTPLIRRLSVTLQFPSPAATIRDLSPPTTTISSKRITLTKPNNQSTTCDIRIKTNSMMSGAVHLDPSVRTSEDVEADWTSSSVGLIRRHSRRRSRTLPASCCCLLLLTCPEGVH